jgi:hypothetical protein
MRVVSSLRFIRVAGTLDVRVLEELLRGRGLCLRMVVVRLRH